MTKFLPFSLLVALCVLLPTLSLPAAEEDEIAAIRALYTKIENAKAADTSKITFNIPNDPMEGSITTDRFAGGLTKIQFSYVAGDHGGADQTFYFGENGLFFVFESAQSWRFGGPDAGGNPTSIDRLVESRFYFKEGVCLRKLLRSAESADAKQLRALIGKVANEEVKPGEEADGLFKRALALRGLSTAGEAERYFGSE